MKCISVCIQGHGIILRKNERIDFIKESIRKNASILTIPSGMGREGLMYAERPTMTMRGSKNKGVSDVFLFGQALDVMSMEYFHNVYHDLSKKPNMTGCEIANDGINFITGNIPLIYANASVPYFHSHKPEKDITTQPSESYKLTKPHYNKLFTMYPNLHEYCNKYTSDCEGGKCKLLRERQRRCPEYGITVLHSSIPMDTEYTLAGLPMVNDITIEKENRLAINLNQMEGHKPLKIKNDDADENFDEDDNHPSQKISSYTFWKKKLIHYKIQEIRAIQYHITYQQRKRETYIKDTEITEEEKQPILLQLDEKITKLKEKMAILERIWQDRLFKYDIMTNELDRFIPRSTLTVSQEKILPEVTLVDLIDIFVNGMKYDHIYIIDPTCNSCDFEGNRPSKLLKMTAHDYVERIRTKTDRPSFLPIEYVRHRNNPSVGTNNPKERIRDLRRTKSIGGKRKKKQTKKRRKK